MFSFFTGGTDENAHIIEGLDNPKNTNDYEKIINETIEYIEKVANDNWDKIELDTEKYNGKTFVAQNQRNFINFFLNSQGIELFEKQTDSGIFELKSKTTMNQTPQQLIELKLLGFEERKKMENDLLKLVVLSEVSDKIQT